MTTFIHKRDFSHAVCWLCCCPGAWWLSDDIPSYGWALHCKAALLTEMSSERLLSDLHILYASIQVFS